VPSPDSNSKLVLLSAFEPSGDDLGSAVVRSLRERAPSLRIAAWGGPRLKEAGAEIVEDTSGDAVMGLPGPRVIAEHIAMHGRIATYMAEHKPDLFVAVDSPAANFPVCKKARKQGVPICHIAAPQLWAWAPWRIRKLRRLTDRLLCLLPFEEKWFASRGVPATFIGHPVFDKPLDAGAIEQRTAGWPTGSLKLALLPGSRAKEHRGNFPLQLAAFRHIRNERPDAVATVGCLDVRAEARLRAIADEHGGWPEGLDVVVGDTEAVIGWADLCLAVSGTVTLHIARQARPLIVMFRANRLAWNLIGRWLIRSPFMAMPNLIAGRKIVPELMPYFGDESLLLRTVDVLLNDESALQAQREALAQVREQFAGHHAAEEAAEAILRLIDHATSNGPGGT
jgi:lipid-A-disaccharide synthase